MKKILLAIFLISFMSLFAQGRRQMDPEKLVENLKTELNLSAEQSQKILEIYSDMAEQIREAFQDADGDRSAMREIMMQIRKDTDKKVMSLLSEEQQEKYKELQKNRMERRPRRNR